MSTIPAKIAALRLVLLFHSGEAWTQEREADWADLIGFIECQTGRAIYAGTEATSRTLCDAVRAVLEA